MNTEGYQKLGRFLLTLICFAAYLFLFIAVLANTLDTNLSHTILG